MIRSKLDLLAKHYHARISAEFDWKPHVFPRYTAPVITAEKKNRLIRPMAFGLIPFFEKNEKPKKVFHNARAETLSEKISFKKAYASQRCLVPLDSFFEYIWDTETHNWLAEVYEKDHGLLTAAGIWNTWSLHRVSESTRFQLSQPSPIHLLKRWAMTAPQYF